MNKVWLITGAGRGLGAAIAECALASGARVVATARRLDGLTRFEGMAGVLPQALDVTDAEQVKAVVGQALARFGRIDVLVNNAGYGQLGPFEETTRDQAREQFATNVEGVFNLCRAVLPAMRAQHDGHLFNVSSMAGISAMAGSSLYCASKFAVEGFTEALAAEVAGFGIRVTLVEPGALRTDFLDPSSAKFGTAPLDDYQPFSTRIRERCAAGNHQQGGDPERLAAAMLHLSTLVAPPLRFLAGSDAYNQVTAKLQGMLEQAREWQALSASIDHA
jgi:NAD(P)-dependent dehydrogenase (short-subunit alcohol dehydrogenase family)